MDTVLLVIHLMVAVALILVVLMQRSAQDGGGLMGGGGTMGGLFTSRGSANLLSRTTAILATLFLSLSLILGIIAGQQHKGESIAEKLEAMPVSTEAPVIDAESKDAVTPVPTEKKAEEPAQPAAPAVPVSK